MQIKHTVNHNKYTTHLRDSHEDDDERLEGAPDDDFGVDVAHGVHVRRPRRAVVALEVHQRPQMVADVAACGEGNSGF